MKKRNERGERTVNRSTRGRQGVGPDQPHLIPLILHLKRPSYPYNYSYGNYPLKGILSNFL